ncbi:MAG: CoA transferase [Pseudomonadota bacterium]
MTKGSRIDATTRQDTPAADTSPSHRPGQDSPARPGAGALDGLQILDLTSVLFGPYATQTLGDWGADIIKIENLAGDLWRYSGLARNRGMSGQFMAVNRNKRSIALDLKQDAGKAVLRRLISGADALVSNVRPAALDRLGFSYTACSALKPDLVYVCATGYGQDGPWAARPAFDEIIQAASGFAASMGSDDSPAYVPSLMADKICALALTSAVVAALLHRSRTGQGQLVEVPMQETLAAFNSIEMLGGSAFEPPIGPTGYNRVRERQPAQTLDGWISMLPYSAEQWCTFFEAVGQPEAIDELGVMDPVQRAANIDRLYARMRDIVATRSTAEWERLLLEIDIPHAPFTRMQDVREQRHLKGVGLFETVEHPSEGTLVQPRPATRFSDSPASVRRPAPRLGQDTRAILLEAGYSAADIERLLSDGAVAE